MNVVFSYGKFPTEEKAKSSKAERQSINIRVYHGKKELGLEARRSTKLEVSLKDWDFDKKELKFSKVQRTPDELRYIRSVQEKLEDIKRAFTREFDELKLSNRLKSLNKTSWNEWCEITLNKGLGIFQEVSQEAPYLIDKINEYVEYSKSDWSISTVKSYNTLVSVLKELEKSNKHRYKTDEIDLKFYDLFQKWMLARGKSNHYFGTLIKGIKTTINHFRTSDIDFKYHPNIGHKKFKAIKESPDHDILTKEQIDLIYHFKGSKKLNQVRDLILIQYHVCLRYSELKEELKDGIEGLSIHKNSEGKYFWNILENKTNKRFKEKKNLPIHKRIRPLVLPPANFPRAISIDKYNKYVKELMDELGIKDVHITSHTIRRSFCTNMWNDGHDPVSILQYSGHSNVRMLMNYIKVKNITRVNTIPTE